MPAQRIGFVESVEGEVAHALRRATLILTREDSPLPRYGRASVRSLGESGSARIMGTGVVICYGVSESEVARHILSSTDRTVVVVTKTKPRKDGPISDAISRCKETDRAVEQVVVKKGSAFAADCAPGGSFTLLASLDAPMAVSTAPSIPRRKAKPIEISRPRLERPSVEPTEVSRPRLERAPVVTSIASAPRLARVAVTSDRPVVESTPLPIATHSEAREPSSTAEEPKAIPSPVEPSEPPVASPVATED